MTTLSRRSFLQTATFGAAALTLPTGLMAAPRGPAPVLHQFQLGDARITALLDGHLALNPADLIGYDGQRAAETLAGSFYRPGANGLEVPVNGYLIEIDGAYTLVDTGTADLMGPDLGGLGQALGAAGVTPEQISTILLTHMHPDHAGGLIKPDGSAAFPNAELVVSETEWAFWHDDAILAGVPEGFRPFFAMARNAVAPYGDRLKRFSGEGEVAKRLSAMPLPGHTPGHTGFHLDAGDEQLLLWGDIIHVSALQFANPGWSIPFDVDPNLAAETRAKMFDRAAADQLLVTGMHIDFPGLGRVAAAGEAYRFEQTPWQFGL